MKTIDIYGKEVNVLAEGVNYMGRSWEEIDAYPRTVTTHNYGGHVHEEELDWVVLEDNNITLYMNNDVGYMVLVDHQITHYEEGRGLVVDKPGRILYTIF